MVKLFMRVRYAVFALLLVSANLSFLGQTASADPTTFPVTGVVMGPNGERLDANVIVYAVSDTTGQEFDGPGGYGTVRPGTLGIGVYARFPSPHFIDANPGVYELDLPADTYDFHYTDASTANIWSSTVVSNVVVAGPTTVNAMMSPIGATHTISGTYTDANNNPIPNAWITASDLGPFIAAQTDQNGSYSMTVPVGPDGWLVQAYDYTNTDPSLPQQWEQTNWMGATASGTTDATVSLQTPAAAVVTATVKDLSGNLDPGQWVMLIDEGNPAIIDTVQTNSQGVAQFTVWADGNYTVCGYFQTDNLATCGNQVANNAVEIDESTGISYNMAVAPITASSTSAAPGQNINFSSSFVDAHFGPFRSAPNTLTWDWGDGSQDVQTYPAATTTPVNVSDSHAYQAAGTYTITLTATMRGRSATTTTSITVGSSTPVSPTLALTTPSPTNQAPGLSWGAVSGATSYNVYSGNGTKIGSTTGTTYADTSASEGTDNYYVTAVNGSGESPASNTVSVVVDRTAPTVNGTSFSTDPLAVSQTTTLSANAADNLSGVAKVEYYTGTDPGAGNGTPMTFANGTASATVGNFTTPGAYTFYVRAEDNAGNWSTPTSVVLDVYNPAGGHTAAHGFITPNGSTSNVGDVLPTETGGNLKATLDYTVKYATTSSTTPTGTSTFSWGSKCNSPKSNCFTVTTDTTVTPSVGGLSWLIVPGDNTATFQGLATLSQGSTTMGTNYPIKISVTGTTTTSPGHYLLQVFPVGSDPSTVTPLYQASGDLTGGSVVMH